MAWQVGGDGDSDGKSLYTGYWQLATATATGDPDIQAIGSWRRRRRRETFAAGGYTSGGLREVPQGDLKDVVVYLRSLSGCQVLLFGFCFDSPL